MFDRLWRRWTQDPRPPAAAPARPAATAAVRPAPAPDPAPPPEDPDVDFDGETLPPLDWGAYLTWLLALRHSEDPVPSGAADRILYAIDRILVHPSCDRLLRRAPGAVPKLLRGVKDEDYSRPEVVAVIEQDPILSAEVMRVARSAVFAHVARGRPSVSGAVDMIGSTGLKQVIARTLVRPLLTAENGGLQKRAAGRIWEDSERFALLGTALAPRYRIEPSETYLACLLYGMGWSALLRAVEINGEARSLHAGLMDDAIFVERLRERRRRIVERLADPWGVPIARGYDEGEEPPVQVVRWRRMVNVVDDMVCLQRLHLRSSAAPASGFGNTNFGNTNFGSSNYGLPAEFNTLPSPRRT